MTWIWYPFVLKFCFKRLIITDHLGKFFNQAVSLHAFQSGIFQQIHKLIRVFRRHSIVVDLTKKPYSMGKRNEISPIDFYPVIINFLSSLDFTAQRLGREYFKVLLF